MGTMQRSHERFCCLHLNILPNFIMLQLHMMRCCLHNGTWSSRNFLIFFACSTIEASDAQIMLLPSSWAFRPLKDNTEFASHAPNLQHQASDAYSRFRQTQGQTDLVGRMNMLKSLAAQSHRYFSTSAYHILHDLLSGRRQLHLWVL